MAGSFSDFLENKILNYLRGTSMDPAPGSVHIGAFTVAPGDGGGGTEVSGGSYARRPVTLGAPSGGQITNSAQVVFADATADWGTIVAVGLYDAASGGNLLAWATLGSTKTINTGARLVIDAAAFTIGVD